VFSREMRGVVADWTVFVGIRLDCLSRAKARRAGSAHPKANS
jgi:hypothetical protein